jgi:glutamine synthetase
MEEDDVVRNALGAHTHEVFINAKRLEWEDYRLEVTNWELEKYLSNY